MGSRRVLLVVAAMATTTSACSDKRAGTAPPGSAAEMLKPLSAPIPASMVRRMVYVPVYSSIYVGVGSRVMRAELTATVSIRNTSRTQPVVLVSSRYYVVLGSDTLGGPGANFLIEWAGPPGVDEPVIEALMLGQVGNAGYSFTSAGRTLEADVGGP